MNILGLIRESKSGIEPVSYYRVGLPLEAINRLTNHEATSYSQKSMASMFRACLQNDKDPAIALEGYDIVVLSRLFHEDGAIEFIEGVHENGGIVVFDTDDDLSEDHRHIDGRGWEFVNMIRYVDAVTVSTQHLARKVHEWVGRRAAVLPNHLHCKWFAEESLKHKKKFDNLTIGVIGTKTHYNDWLYLEGVFERLSKKHDVTILCAGFQPDYLEEYEYLPPVPYAHYPRLMRQFDIVCCALDPDDMFNHAKSAIKALEAMCSARTIDGRVAGAVPVCTNMPVYNHVVSHNNTGLLVNNDDWYEALDMLIQDSKIRRRLAYKGHRWVKNNRDITRSYKKWLSVYDSLAIQRQQLGPYPASTGAYQ